MDCETVKQELVAYLQDELEEAVRRQVAEHLEGCAACQQWLQEAEESLAEAKREEEPSVVRLASQIIEQALRDGASDIHVDLRPPDSCLVRYRVDGVLYDLMALPAQVHAPLVSRFKVMANLDVAEKRLPQDGRILLQHEGQDYDLRVSTFPGVEAERVVLRCLDREGFRLELPQLGLWPEDGVEAERVVLRCLDREGFRLELPQLGLWPEDEERLRALLATPSGIVLFAGPTGCGKTTVLLAALAALNSMEKNVWTIEEPVLYEIPGIHHSSVNRTLGLTYPVALRHLLERDPDVIMVGELADRETAETSLDGAQTGHLILTQMYAHDAVGALQRLLDFGLPPFLVADTVAGVCSTRLARKICEVCREPYDPPETGLEALGLKPGEATFYHGAGCENCRQTGYKGRTALFEILTMTDGLRATINAGGDEAALREAALASGFRPLRKDGRRKVLEGISTVEEVLRVTGSLF